MRPLLGRSRVVSGRGPERRFGDGPQPRADGMGDLVLRRRADGGAALAEWSTSDPEVYGFVRERPRDEHRHRLRRNHAVAIASVRIFSYLPMSGLRSATARIRSRAARRRPARAVAVADHVVERALHRPAAPGRDAVALRGDLRPLLPVEDLAAVTARSIARMSRSCMSEVGRTKAHRFCPRSPRLNYAHGSSTGDQAPAAYRAVARVRTIST